MQMYTILLRRHGLDPDRDIVVLKDGFSWPAFLLGGLWALWHRMWWVALGLIIGAAGLSGFGVMVFADTFSPQVLTFAFALLAGILAHDLRLWSLERRGFVEGGIVSARNREEALLRFLEEDTVLADDIYWRGVPS